LPRRLSSPPRLVVPLDFHLIAFFRVTFKRWSSVQSLHPCPHCNSPPLLFSSLY
jgi:hypothetical protein